ncbi:MAG: hypothetical protein ACFCVD_19140 [Nodosilinea sp.]
MDSLRELSVAVRAGAMVSDAIYSDAIYSDGSFDASEGTLIFASAKAVFKGRQRLATISPPAPVKPMCPTVLARLAELRD